MREYRNGVLVSERVLRVAEKDVRRGKRREKKAEKKRGGLGCYKAGQG
jgi:hypothetical protein